MTSKVKIGQSYKNHSSTFVFDFDDFDFDENLCEC